MENKQIQYHNLTEHSSSLRRFSGIDVLKCVAAYMVVIIHFVNTGKGTNTEIFLSQLCNAQERAAIPVFFMITGFFYGSMIKRGGLEKHIKKILILTIIATLFYVFYIGALFCLYEGTLAEYIRKTFSSQKLIEWVFLNNAPAGIHLWYLYAVIYVLILMRILDKLGGAKLLYILGIGCFAALLIGNYTMVSPTVPYTRNFMFAGLPFVLLGRTIALPTFTNITNRLSKAHLICLLLVGVLFVTVELVIREYVLLFDNPMLDYYTFTPIVAIALFLLALKSTNLNSFEQKLSTIGLKYSTYIYIVHVFCGNTIVSLSPYDNFWWKTFVSVPVIFLFSLVGSMILIRCNKFI